jgi:hypothetical protein
MPCVDRADPLSLTLASSKVGEMTCGWSLTSSCLYFDARGPFIGVLAIAGELTTMNMYANLILRASMNTTPNHSVLESLSA